MNAATSRNKRFEWTKEMGVAFRTLKKALSTPPVPAFPEFDRPFVVGNDASLTADGKVHLVEFPSSILI